MKKKDIKTDINPEKEALSDALGMTFEIDKKISRLEATLDKMDKELAEFARSLNAEKESGSGNTSCDDEPHTSIQLESTDKSAKA